MKNLKQGYIVLFGMLLMCLTTYAQQQIDKDQLKKANSLFDDGEFLGALEIYRQLLSISPEDQTLNYKYGACLIYSDEDTSEPVKYLRYGASSATDPLAYYYLGKAYHLNYQFADAQNSYNQFLEKADDKLKDKYADGQQLVNMAKNGQTLLSQIKEIVVIDKVEASEKEFFRSYKIDDLGGKIIVTPEDLQTKKDKESGENSLIYFQGNNSDIYYSSYGSGKQRDIYKVKRLENGKYTKPVLLGDGVNTAFDENYPYMHPDGQTLYFSSKGHNSMGGYDVFKCVLNPNTGKFGPAENLDFAISSPDDDLFYIADLNKENAFFASGRSSALGRLNVYQVKVEAGTANMAVIKGNYIATDNNDVVSIRIEDATNNTEIGVFESDPNTGEYLLNLPKSGKYKFYVEEEGSNTIHSGVFEVPRSRGNVAYAQEMTFSKIGGTNQLVLNNLFENPLEDDVSSLMAEALKRKGQLDINKDDFTNELSTEENPMEEAYVAAGFPMSSSNEKIREQTAQKAKEYAQESADDLADAKMIYAYAKSKKGSSKELLGEAHKLYEKSKVELDVSKKEELLLEAAQKKMEASKENQEAENALGVLLTLDKNGQAKYEKYEAYELSNEKMKSSAESDDFEDLVVAMEENLALTKSGEMPGTLELIQEENQEKRRQSSRALEFAQKIESEKQVLEEKLVVREKQLENTTKKKDKEIISQDIAGMKEELADYDIQIEGAYKRYKTRLNDQANSEYQGELYSQYKLRRENDEWSVLTPEEYSDQELAEFKKDIRLSKREADKIKIDDVEISQLLAKRTDIAHRFDFGNIVRSSEVDVTEREVVFQPKDPEDLEFVEDEIPEEDLVVINKYVESDDDYQVFLINAAKEDNSVSEYEQKINEYKIQKDAATSEDILLLDKRIADLESLKAKAVAEIENTASVNDYSPESIAIAEKEFEAINEQEIIDWVKSDYFVEKQNIIDSDVDQEEKQLQFDALNLKTSQEIAEAKSELLDIYNAQNNSDSDNALKNIDYLTQLETEFSNRTMLLPANDAVADEVVDPENDELSDTIVEEDNSTTMDDVSEDDNLNVNDGLNDANDLDAVDEMVVEDDAVLIDDTSLDNNENFIDDIVENETDPLNDEFVKGTGIDVEDNTVDDVVENVTDDVADDAIGNVEDDVVNNVEESNADDVVENFSELSDDFENVQNDNAANNESDLSDPITNTVEDVLNADETVQFDDVEEDSTAESTDSNQRVDETENEIDDETELAVEKPEPKVNLDELIFDEEAKLTENQMVDFSRTAEVDDETQKYLSELQIIEDSELLEDAKEAAKRPLLMDYLSKLETKRLSNFNDVHADPLLIEETESKNEAIDKLIKNGTLTLDKASADKALSRDIYFSQKELVKSRYRSDYIDELTSINENVTAQDTKAQQKILLDNMIAFKLENEIKSLEASLAQPDISDFEKESLTKEVDRKRKDYNEIRWTNTITLSELNSPVTEEVIYERQKERSYTSDDFVRESDYTNLIKNEGYKTADLHFDEAKMLQEEAELDLLILESRKPILSSDEINEAEIKVAEQLIQANAVELNELNLSLDNVDLKKYKDSDKYEQIEKYLSKAETWNNTVNNLTQLSASATGTQKSNILKEQLAAQLNAIEYKRHAQAMVNYLDKGTDDETFVFSDFVIPNSEIASIQEKPNYQLANEVFDEQYTPPNYLTTTILADNTVNDNIEEEDTERVDEFETIDEEQGNTITENDEGILSPDSVDLLTVETLTEDDVNEALIRLNKESVKKVQPLNSNGVAFSGERMKAVEDNPENKKTQSALVYYQKKSLIDQLKDMKVDQLKLQKEYADKIYDKEQHLIVVNESIASDGYTDVLVKEHNRLVAELDQLRKYDAIAKENVLQLDRQVDDEETSLANLKQAMDEEEALSEFEVVEELNVPEIPSVLIRNIYIRSNANEAGYSDANPIPVNPEMPGGIIYQVQVGAYRQPIPQDLFKGFTPIMGERIQSGITRYKVGLFTSYNNANTAKAEIREMGYSDAFVVVFNDGDRITFAEARAITDKDPNNQLSNNDENSVQFNATNTDDNSNEIGGNDQASSEDNNDNVSSNIPENVDVTELPVTQPTTIDNTNGTGIETLDSYVYVEDESKDDYYNDPDAAVAKQVEMIKGLFYTVQIGAYSKPVSADKLLNVNPLNTELTDKGLVRYTTGRFTDLNNVSRYKTEIINKGVTDAFVSAYYNGFRITLSKAKQLLEDEGQNVLIDDNDKTDGVIGSVVDNTASSANDSNVANNNSSEEDIATNNPNTNDVRPKDDVLDAAYSLVENGMPGQMIWDLLEEEGLLDALPAEDQTYKVILGPFEEAIPTREVEIILNFRDNIRFEERGDYAYVYSSINPIPYTEARALKETLEEEGIETAKIVSFKGGREISLKEFLDVLSK